MKYSILTLIAIFLIPGALALAQELSVTVYNDNLGLVREIRKMTIEKGKSQLNFIDVAALIDPTSVHLKSKTSPDKFEVLEQNFEYDLASAHKILQKYLDREITLVTKSNTFLGTLLSAGGGDVVLREKDGNIRIIREEQIHDFGLGELPEGLITRPTLLWMVSNSGNDKQDIELSYLTRGLTWHAEYVAVVDADDKHLDISGWVSLDNKSGATYKNAKLKLVAGDVHRVEEVSMDYMIAEEAMPLAPKRAQPQFEEKSFFEYHLYTLSRKTTLKDNQTKQVSLFSTTDVPAKKIYVYDGGRYEDKVRVEFEVVNGKKQGLGMPLPKGKVRVYKADTDGALEFIGEDAIDHTPSDEKVRLFLGNAFDIVGERTQKRSERISDRSRKSHMEIVIRNHKKTAVEIVVLEHLWGDWDIITKSHDFKRKSSSEAEFLVNVPADGETKLTYTALLKW